MRPGDELNGLLREQAKIRKQFAGLLDSTGIGRGAGSLKPDLYWELLNADDAAVATLGASYSRNSGGNVQAADTFYYASGGPFAWRCLLALEAKALAYTPHLVDLSKHENRTPEFLALNARGTLPVLREGLTAVRESQAIMFYLECAHPAPPLPPPPHAITSTPCSTRSRMTSSSTISIGSGEGTTRR